MEDLDTEILKRYDIIKKIGKGRTSLVYKAFDRKSDEFIAIKKIHDVYKTKDSSQRIYREILYTSQLKNKYCIEMKKIHKGSNEKDVYIVLNLMETDLTSVIKSGILESSHIKYIIFQILKGVEYLHRSGIVHRDIKPGNILINSNGKIRICDLGHSRSIDYIKTDEINEKSLETNIKHNKTKLLTESPSERWYSSPEILLNSKEYNNNSDIWSIGCIFGEMIGGTPIFPGNSTLNQLDKILEVTGKPTKEDIYSLKSEHAMKVFDSIFSIKTESLKNKYKSASTPELELLNGMLQFNPNKRLSLSQLIDHYYFKDLKYDVEDNVFIKKFEVGLDDYTLFDIETYKESNTKLIKGFKYNISKILETE